MLTHTFFRFCPRCGKRGIASFEKNGMHCPGCGYVYFHNCASSVAAIIETKQGILLTKRNTFPKKGLLDLPGGFSDYHESLEEALTREIREELGCELDRLSYFGSFPNKYRYRSVTYFTIDAVFVCKARNLSRLKPNSELSEVLFAQPSTIDLSRIAFPSTRAAIETYAHGARKASRFVS
jgi:NAD+ diphosphatase